MNKRMLLLKAGLLLMLAITSATVILIAFAEGSSKEELTGEADIYQGGNNLIDLDLGERISTLWRYKYDGVNWGESCWREEYSLWYSGAIHESSGFAIDDYYGTTYNDADTHARLHTGNLYVDRDIYISTGNNRFFQISYVITNEGTTAYSDVRWFQQVDYDVPATIGSEYWDDTGWYDSATDFVWIKDPDYFQNGFTGSRPSSNHGMDHYSTELVDDHDGNLNGANSYYGDPAVGLQYNIGMLDPGESWDITMTFWFGIPLTVVADAGPDQTVDQYTPVTFDGSGSYTTGTNYIVEYAWDFDGDFDYDDGYGVNPIHTFNEYGTFQVWLRVTDDYALEAFDAMTVTVNEVTLTLDKSVSPTSIYVDGTGASPETTTITIDVTGFGGTLTETIPIDAVFAIDSSGSMGYVDPIYGPLGNDPYGLRMTAAKDFVDKLDSTRDQGGVVSWDTGIDFTYGLTNDFVTLKSQIDLVDSSGGTNLNVGLNSAIAMLDANTRIGSSSKTIIFLTDGVGSYTYSGYPGSPADDAASKGYVIYSIGLGSASTSPLTDMSTATGGQYFSSPSATNLQAVFDAILTEIVTQTAPYDVDVVEVTESYIINEGSFSIAPDSVTEVGGNTVITWLNVAQYVGDYDNRLTASETFSVSFTAKSSLVGHNLPVDDEQAVVNFMAPSDVSRSQDLPQAYIDVRSRPVAIIGGPYFSTEGTAVTFDASASYDADGDPLLFRWDFNNDGLWDTGYSSIPIATMTWFDDHWGMVAVEVFDGTLSDVAGTTVTVFNVAPSVDAGSDQTVDEGSLVYFSGSFTDPGVDTWTFEWVFDDGSPPQTGAATSPVTTTHAYGDNDVYTVVLTITDDDGGIGTDSLVVTVNNVPPTITEAVVDNSDPYSGEIIYFSCDYTDPGWLDTHTVVWNFGDGNSETGNDTSHFYNIADTYTVTLTVEDDDGGVATTTLQITVHRIPMEIDIKPWCPYNVINPDSQGVTQVVVFNDGSFEGEWIEESSVRFGPGGAIPIRWHWKDWDHDGDLDVLFFFNTEDIGLQHGDTSATLTADLSDGRQIVGSDIVKTVPPEQSYKLSKVKK